MFLSNLVWFYPVTNLLMRRVEMVWVVMTLRFGLISGQIISVISYSSTFILFYFVDVRAQVTLCFSVYKEQKWLLAMATGYNTTSMSLTSNGDHHVRDDLKIHSENMVHNYDSVLCV